MKQEKSVAAQVSGMLDAQPYVQQAVKLGIANYSAIAKKLHKKTGGSFEAVKVAVMRYADGLEKSVRGAEPASEVLSGAKLSLRNNVSLIIIEKDISTLLRLSRLFEERVEASVVNSQNAITIITDDNNFEKIARIFKTTVIKKQKGLCLLLLTTSPSIEDTPGVVWNLFEKLAQAGINVIEFYSCWTDNGFLVDRKDALRAFETIEKLV